MLVIAVCQNPQEVLGWRDLHSDVLYIYIYFLIFNYLAMSGLSCGMWDVCCIMQDLLWWCTVSVVALCGFSSCNTQAPECTGSLIVAHGLSCPATCGIFFFLTLQYCIGFCHILT